MSKKSSNINTNFEDVQKFLRFLNSQGVDFVEMRTLPALNTQYTTKIVSTNEQDIEEVITYIKKNELEYGTVNCTFNNLTPEVLSENRAVKDADINRIAFLMIDFDPKRPDSKSNAANDEKNAAKKVMDEAVTFLEQEGLGNLAKFDSGNGYHVFIPIEAADVNKVKELSKKLLMILDDKFSNEAVEVDRSVFNPARLGKLIGTPAVKAEHTEERPQRLSRIIELPEEVGKKNEVKTLEQLVEKYEITEVDDQVNKKRATTTKNSPFTSDDFIRVNVEEWFACYPELKYDKRPGDIGGVTLYVFEKCPFSEHRNNQNGASVSVTADGKARARCLHESDGDKNIFDLAKAYPIPEVARLDRSSHELITIDGLAKGYSYTFENYELSQNGLWQREKNNPPVKISNPIFIRGIHRTIESNEIRLSLCHWANNEWLRLTVDGSLLQANTFKQLVKNGLVFKSRSESNVIDFLHLQKEALTVSLEHKIIGWVEEEGDLIYQASSSHAKNLVNRSTLSPSSTYDLSDFGEAAQFDELIKNEVIGTELELAAAIGLSSIPLGYFNTSRSKVMNNLIINLQGVSSTGKTAALMFIASLYGNPNTIVRNFNATNNAIIKLATDNHGGVPLIFDELGAANVKDLSSLFFQLASGEERLRMDVNRELVKQQKFEVIVLMSSEEHVEFYLQKDIDGLKVRHLEFSDIKWTKSAEHAETIKTAIQNNYGHIVKRLIAKLFEEGVDSLNRWFDESKVVLLSKMKEDSLKNRIAENLALIRTGALMGVHLLGWPLNLNNIDRYLIQAYTSLIDKSRLNKMSPFEKIKELLVLNANKFIATNSNETRKFSPIWGKVSITKAGELKVNIISHAFEELLRKEFQVRDVTYIIKNLLSDGKMQAENGRNTKRVRINKQSITTYEILLPNALKQYFAINAQESQSSRLESPLFDQTPLEEDDFNF